MRKSVIVSLLTLLALILTSCSNKISPPIDRLNKYVDLWENEEWTHIYNEYVVDTSQNEFGKEQIIDRAEKIYTDLNIKSVKVDVANPNDNKSDHEGEKSKFLVQITMDTIAGEIQFKKDITLIYKEQNEEENWFIEWDPSFILPDLKVEDKVRIASIHPMRGEIFDRHDKPIAINGSGAEIGIVAGDFNPEMHAGKLASLVGTTSEHIINQLNQSWVEPGHFVPIKKLPFTLQNKYEEALLITGVSAMKAEMREYPYAHALAHLVGYLGKINGDELKVLSEKGYTEEDSVGKRGLEQLLEERLRGQDGIQIYIEKADKTGEKIILAEKPAVDGDKINLTIDAELQTNIYEEIKEERGTATVVNPKTGETLALLSTPAFDPNEFALGVTAARYSVLTEDPSEPMLNRFSSSYAPGSSIKPITAAIGLTEGTLNPDEAYVIEGLKWKKDVSWQDYQVTRVSSAPNPVNLEKALVYSDNIYFAKEALKMKETLAPGLEKYGFGEETPYKYGVRSSQISNDGSLHSEGQLIDTSFGQGEMLVNIVHLATTYGAIINEGTMIKPVLFNDEEFGEVWKDELLSTEHAQLLKQYLRSVVTDGFLDSVNRESVKISGKTGTAELKSTYGDKRRENGFFVAYPTDSEDYIIAMMIEGIEDKGGSIYVAEKVANIMESK